MARRSSRPRVTFAYVLYTSCARSNRPDSDYTRMERGRMYARGLLLNAAALAAHMPEADMVVYVPEAEVAAYEGRCGVATRTEAAVNAALAFVFDQLRAHRHVTVRTFTPGDVGVTGTGTGTEVDSPCRMSLGQRLRCARYLPLFAGPAGGALAQPVVVRDADSVVTPTDVDLVRAWAVGSAPHLVYQEYQMSPTLPMGGGVGSKVSWGAAADLRAAIASTGFDEAALRDVMPAALRADLTRDTALSHGWWVRRSKASRTAVFRRPSCVVVRTRMQENGTYFTWSPRGGARLLWRVTSRHTGRLEPVQPVGRFWTR